MQHRTNTFTSQHICQDGEAKAWHEGKEQRQTAKGAPRAFHGGRTGLPKAKGHDMETMTRQTQTAQRRTSGVPRRAHGLAKGKGTWWRQGKHGQPKAHLGRSTAGARACQRQRDMTWRQGKHGQPKAHLGRWRARRLGKGKGWWPAAAGWTTNCQVGFGTTNDGNWTWPWARIYCRVQETVAARLRFCSHVAHVPVHGETHACSKPRGRLCTLAAFFEEMALRCIQPLAPAHHVTNALLQEVRREPPSSELQPLHILGTRFLASLWPSTLLLAGAFCWSLSKWHSHKRIDLGCASEFLRCWCLRLPLHLCPSRICIQLGHCLLRRWICVCQGVACPSLREDPHRMIQPPAHSNDYLWLHAQSQLFPAPMPKWRRTPFAPVLCRRLPAFGFT